ncbi:hypothetical protein CSB45_15255 [candidate division KSB3 bacterium]|uniref:Formylmethanofuran dehydrogenase subunit E domain-containing protein n=1 Tax=candidate division KSB3 bacterium TaxID=2044937 RepID=A0A2G6E0M1_9BACT|nr:MAG: hypothetical protein CSB45_15255 [candidate division KSB3 bacterium]
MSDTITVLHDSGEVAVSYDELVKYHDKNHWGGVALAWKIIQLAAEILNENKALDRNLVRIRTGLNPPGLVDGFEYLTRAVTRQRLVVDPSLNQGPKSPFGSFSFVIGYGDKRLGLQLKEGLLPDDFATLGKKCQAGMGSEEEKSRWVGIKHSLGDVIMDKAPRELFDIVEQP